MRGFDRILAQCLYQLPFFLTDTWRLREDILYLFLFFCILFFLYFVFFVFCILVSIACVLNSKLRQTPVASARTAHPLDDNRSCNFPSRPQENTWNKRSTVKITYCWYQLRRREYFPSVSLIPYNQIQIQLGTNSMSIKLAHLFCN